MTDNSTKKSSNVDQILALDKHETGHKQLKLWIGVIFVLVLFVIGLNYFSSDKDSAIQFKTAEVQQGDLTITVTATGKLEPVNQVEVSTEVSGTIESVHADYNDHVKAGQILARLNTDQLEARFRQSTASLDLANARVKEAEATVIETRNKFQRSQTLAKKGLCPQEDCDATEASYKRAEAAHAITRAQVKQARAQLDVDQTALAKAVILSPIKGIVLTRSVEPGQTVAASFQAPVLFVLAEDLTKMELHVDIDEADVGQILAQQKASFTVDAYPEHRFSAHILKVHYAPQVVQDVVTYEAMLAVDNSELLLRPGMTATADIIIRQVENTMLVPNAALRFNPPQTSSTDRSMLRSLLPGPRRQPEKQRKVILSHQTQQRVWVLQDGIPKAITITIGSTNGRMTEVLDGEIMPGMPLLVDVIRVN